MEYHIKTRQALDRLRASASEQSTELLQLGSLTVRFYAPRTVDRQQPHTRDEVYVIANGSATFRCCGRDIPVEQGDVLTVPAGQEHLFIDFTPNFATWIFFYGPEGGEQTSTACCSDQSESLPHSETVTSISPASPPR
ncbi:MAG TPA: cupin domain-containing protein [Terracidiphilus sp.]|nr:cupin domain-containing protein [Terracidiphilus sp.]